MSKGQKGNKEAKKPKKVGGKGAPAGTPVLPAVAPERPRTK